MDHHIDNIQYTPNAASNLQLAMENMISAFTTRNQPKRQKIHVIFLNANPTYDYNVNHLTTQICSKATQAKQQSMTIKFTL